MGSPTVVSVPKQTKCLSGDVINAKVLLVGGEVPNPKPSPVGDSGRPRDSDLSDERLGELRALPSPSL